MIGNLNMRAEWIAKRSGQANVSQMHYARQGVETEEMHYVAKTRKPTCRSDSIGSRARTDDYSRQYQSR